MDSKSVMRQIIKKTPFIFIIRMQRKLRLIKDRKRIGNSYYTEKISLINEWSRKNSEDSNFYYDLTQQNLDYLGHFIANLTHVDHQSVMDLFRELEQNSNLRDHIQSQLNSSNYDKKIDVRYGRRVGWYALIRITKPKLVVETGVDHGVGACVIAQALILNTEEGFPGRYLGTDINPKAGQLFTGKYVDVGKVAYGDSVTTLESLEENIDIFINDSDHSSIYEKSEYNSIRSKLSPHALILGDNSHSTSALADFSLESGRRFYFFPEEPKDHWYPGAGIGVSK